MDIQKTMEFILEQQAAQAAALARISEKEALWDERFDRLALMSEQHEVRLGALQALLEDHDRDLNIHEEWLTSISRELQIVSELMRQAMAAEARLEITLDEFAQQTKQSEKQLSDALMPLVASRADHEAMMKRMDASSAELAAMMQRMDASSVEHVAMMKRMDERIARQDLLLERLSERQN